MTYPLLDARALSRLARIAEAFETWMREEAGALIEAAELLGGLHWGRRAARVVDALASGACPASLLPDLEALRRLLTLEMTDDPFGAEAERFMSVHPDDPRADAARLCAEALERGIPALRALAAVGATSRPEAA